MNRMEEYQELMVELDQPVPALAQTLERAKRKRKRRRLVYRPLIGVAAAFALFVVLVNVSVPVAYACSQVPFLRELAEAVTFSNSLSDAVDNEYVQTINLIQQDGEVSAKVEYLIVDQKQVNVFYRLYSDVYSRLNADPEVLDADGSAPARCSYMTNGWDIPNGELNSLTIDFVNDNVPGSLRLQLNIRDMGSPLEDGEAPANMAEQNVEDGMFIPTGPEEEDYIAHFDFLLEFDPQFTETGKEFAVNETVILEGQRITIEKVGVYPTYLSVHISDDPENTAWLKRLDFYVVTDKGMVFEPVSGGITATGSSDTPTMDSFRADSTYFYDAKELKLVITGAEWLRKDMEKVYINLETGETGEMPENVEFVSAEKRSRGWILKLRAPHRKEHHTHQILSSKFFDAEGRAYDIRRWGAYSEYSQGDASVTHFIEEVPLADYHASKVWVAPLYSHEWEAKEPVVVNVQ